ncbi:8300_t:CDS:10 [Entrophospora sp. SA101]|nr:8300_t:CDS:10 [Entrophospora sp. SA101]
MHSFTCGLEEMKRAVSLGLYLGVNGCSLKTQENLDVVKQVPEDRLMIETDSPWCDIRSTHASYSHLIKNLEKSSIPTSYKKERFQEGYMVKGRNEPCSIVQVLHVLASIRNADPELLAEKIYENTTRTIYTKRLFTEHAKAKAKPTISHKRKEKLRVELAQARFEEAKAKAKTISSIVYQKEKVVLSEVQKRITIGCDWGANLTIDHPDVASIQCILSIKPTNNMHYVKELNFDTIIKNGWNKKTFVNSIPLGWNDEYVLNHNDKIFIKTQGGFIEVEFFEDAKINHLPAQSGEKYHVVNDSNGNDKTGKSCIIKKIRSNNDNDDNIYAAKIINVSDGNFKYRNEIDILKILDHENIIKVVDDYFDEKNIVIILPYLCGGSLEDYIKTLNDSNFNQVKLISFGESKKIEGSIDSMGNYIEQTSTDIVGTPLYTAPELAKALKNKLLMFRTGIDSDSDTAQCDLDFSTFKSTRNDIDEIETVVDFILKLCQVDKDQRMTADQALQHTILN